MTATALVVSVGTLLFKLVVLATIIALMETQMAKLRLFRVPELLSLSFVLGLLAVTSAFLLR
jgi:formate hydrogenlyase subunit 4